MLDPLKKVQIVKDDKKVSSELSGSYGNTLVIMSSNPEEIDIACSKLGSDYSVVMDTIIMDNNDYAKVVVRKSKE